MVTRTACAKMESLPPLNQLQRPTNTKSTGPSRKVANVKGGGAGAAPLAAPKRELKAVHICEPNEKGKYPDEHPAP